MTEVGAAPKVGLTSAIIVDLNDNNNNKSNFARKFSVHNLRIERTLETTKLNNWLNRSLDQSPHDRLYNEAKYFDARLAHKQRMHRNPDVDGCTFQPQLGKPELLMYSHRSKTNEEDV
jgi:hypothetical protein